MENKPKVKKWAFMKWWNIPTPDGRQTYLRRLRVIQTPLFAIYIHWLYLPDEDRDCHDHPFHFWSFILRGGYQEVVQESPHLYHRLKVQKWGRFSFHEMPIDLAHRIIKIQTGTVSLVVTGVRRKDWGFWTESGFVPWYEYDRSGYGPDPFEH